MNVTIGILGGMGPRASVVFEQRLLDALLGIDQALPKIISINDGTIPDRTSFLTGQGIDPLEQLKSNAAILAAAGAQIVCMPCNTAHAPQILGRLQAQLAIPIVDMPGAAVLRLENLGAKNVLVLGTRGTRIAKVYSSRSMSLKCRYPSDNNQKLIDQAIAAIKAGQPPEALAKSISHLINASHTDSVILACTELSLLKDFLSVNKPVVDAMDALIETCLGQIVSYTKIKELI